MNFSNKFPVKKGFCKQFLHTFLHNLCSNDPCSSFWILSNSGRVQFCAEHPMTRKTFVIYELKYN